MLELIAFVRLFLLFKWYVQTHTYTCNGYWKPNETPLIVEFSGAYCDGLFTPAVTGAGTGAMMNGTYAFMQNFLHCTWTGTRSWTGMGKNELHIHFRILKLFQVVCFNGILMAFRVFRPGPSLSQFERFLYSISPCSGLIFGYWPVWLHHEFMNSKTCARTFAYIGGHVTDSQTHVEVYPKEKRNIIADVS